MFKKKKLKLEPIMTLTKSKDQVDLVANAILSIMKINKIQYLLLEGQIGAGKTSLVQEIAKLLGEESKVVSPTFNKMLTYNDFVHIDAYQMENQDLNQFYDYFQDKFVFIEWAKNLNEVFENYLIVNINVINENEREYKIEWKEK